MLERSNQVVDSIGVEPGAEREKRASRKCRPAKGSLELHEAKSVQFDVVIRRGQRLREAAAEVGGALIQCDLCRIRSRCLVVTQACETQEEGRRLPKQWVLPAFSTMGLFVRIKVTRLERFVDRAVLALAPWFRFGRGLAREITVPFPRSFFLV